MENQKKIKKKKTNLRKENMFFHAVGLGKGNRPYHYFKEEDQFILKLVPEPKNKYDKNAIKILVDDTHVAYVAADECQHVKAFLKREKEKDHIMSYCLIDVRSASARFLITDLTLSLKRRKKN